MILDLPYHTMCDCHLQYEHAALHRVWDKVLHGTTEDLKHDPQVLRWVNHKYALVVRHCEMMEEYRKRGLEHDTPLELTEGSLASLDKPPLLVPLTVQRTQLRLRECVCGGNP